MVIFIVDIVLIISLTCKTAFPILSYTRPLYNTNSVFASEAKQSHKVWAFNEIATSLALLAMTKKQLCKCLLHVIILKRIK